MRGAGETILVAQAGLSVVGVSLDKVGHRVLWTPAVHDLLRAVVRVHNVGPGHVAKVLATLQLLDRFADLELYH